MPLDPLRQAIGKANLDPRAGLHQRLAAHVPASEQQRFARVLTALEAHHTNELHTQTRIAHESRIQSEAAEGHAAVLKHTAAAKEAKQACHLEAARADSARLQRMLAQRDSQLAAALARAELAERRAMASEAAFGAELASLEIEADETHRRLRDYAVAHELKSEHLQALQQQASKSSSLLAHMQEQATDMQKRLAAQQRKSLRLQESHHLTNATAKSWSHERKTLLHAAGAAEQMAREAVARQTVLEAEHASLAGEIDAERLANAAALTHQRELAAAADASLRNELRGLQTLRAALLDEPCKVTLKSGGSATVGQFVKALEERQQRQRRGGGANALASLAPAVAPPIVQLEQARAVGVEAQLLERISRANVMLGGGGGVARATSSF